WFSEAFSSSTVLEPDNKDSLSATSRVYLSFENLTVASIARALYMSPPTSWFRLRESEMINTTSTAASHAIAVFRLYFIYFLTYPNYFLVVYGDELVSTQEEWRPGMGGVNHGISHLHVVSTGVHGDNIALPC